MKGFKDSTRTKYMCGGPVKKFDGGGVYNERGKRATWDEVAAEGLRMERRKPPVEGISTRPTDDSGRRMTNEELGMTPGGVDPAKKKAMPKGIGQMTEREGRAAKEAMKKPSTAAAGSGVMAAARAAARAAAALPRGLGVMSDRDMQMAKDAMKKGVPAHSNKPMIRRKTGGLTAMPKGKC